MGNGAEKYSEKTHETGSFLDKTKQPECFHSALAGMGNSAALQHMKNSVIQRASVGVSVVPCADAELCANEVYVNTINFGGRFDTGLKNKTIKKRNYTNQQTKKAAAIVAEISTLQPEQIAEYNFPARTGDIVKTQVWEMLSEEQRSYMVVPNIKNTVETESPTQGDHVIADAFIKKYQKDVVKGRTVADALIFYENLGNEIIADNNMASEVDERIMASKTLIANSLELIHGSKDLKTSTIGWNIMLKEVIKKYNMGYAKSLLSTQGTGTGGKGEKSGMETIRSIKNEQATMEVSSLMNLFDVKSALALHEYQKLGYESMAGIPQEEASRYMQNVLGQMTAKKEPGEDGTSSGINMFNMFIDESNELMTLPMTSRFLTMAGWYGNDDNLIYNRERSKIKSEFFEMKAPYKLLEKILRLEKILIDVANLNITAGNLNDAVQNQSFDDSEVENLAESILEAQSKIFNLISPFQAELGENVKLNIVINELIGIFTAMEPENKDLARCKSCQDEISMQLINFKGDPSNVEHCAAYERLETKFLELCTPLGGLINVNLEMLNGIAEVAARIKQIGLIQCQEYWDSIAVKKSEN